MTTRQMKERVYGFRLLASVLAALTLSGPAIAGESVPFKGGAAGIIINLGLDPVRNIVTLHQTGTGQATHLGSFTVDATREIDLTGGPGRATWVVTAANGDMLLLVGVGGGATGPTTAVGTLRIVGGTGRFEGATGLLQLAITFAIAPPTSDPNPYIAVLEGAISLGH